MKKLQIELANFPQSTILDIGTGYGSFIEILTKNFNDYREIIGIDTSQTAIDAAKNHFKDYERIKFIKSDAFTMHFENETFDIITLSNSLHHLHNLPTLFDQMRRVLKKDGIVIVNEMLSDPLTLPQISHRLIHHFAAEIDREKGIIHDETFTESDI
jgi:ubiquinone/menaquinone biosynthesis C-methylase UbiE